MNLRYQLQNPIKLLTWDSFSGGGQSAIPETFCSSMATFPSSTVNSKKPTFLTKNSHFNEKTVFLTFVENNVCLVC